ncbi:MAG TPA: putative toxin-antitoxin system toxin component, PIN family [Verrucomicrobiae bacterium]|nr:putative toxin-antitoxin system toxin component, PIN family [Verrucomicrobiae bacterium]
MKVVVDTNVIVAGLVAEGTCRDILKRRLPACELLASQPLLNELAEKMREKFGLDPANLPLLKIYADTVTLVKPEPLPKPICRDSDDDAVLATALAGGVELILTGDNDLLALKEFQGIKILSPRQFVELLDRPK